MTGIERLRNLAKNEMVFGFTGAHDVLTSIADQIEREQDAMVADSPYDAILPEDRDAAAWVREHGGLDYVKREWRSRVPYDRYERRRQRLLGHIAECEAALGRRNHRIEELGKTIEFFQLNNSNFRHLLADVAERLGFTRFGNDYEPEDLLDALDRRLMPEGCEWPRYESGEPVIVGEYGVNQVDFYSDGLRTVWGNAANHENLLRGERVRRPTVLAADDEPLEVGQTVWGVYTGERFVVEEIDLRIGAQVKDKNGESHVCSFESLTHQRHVLDADGNRIEPAMDVWWICEGDERGIHAEKLHVESIGKDGLVTCDPFNGGTWVELEPSELYVHKPVLDADGVPIREGDTVYGTVEGGPFTVTEVSDKGSVFVDAFPDTGMHGSMFTHEPPDSWERIEKDAGKSACTYFCHSDVTQPPNCGHDVRSCRVDMTKDLVRRCRALAERGE